jgi:hypothetical protein
LHVFPRVSRYGEIGVDVFFVISGFVMAPVTHGLPPGVRSARSFMAARFARVVPLYWIPTALFIALVAFVPGVPDAFDHARVSAWHTLSSFLFLPSISWTGIAAPVLGVGWTLNYEMWFYAVFAVFAVAMWLTKRRLVAVGAFLLLTSRCICCPVRALRSRSTRTRWCWSSGRVLRGRMACVGADGAGGRGGAIAGGGRRSGPIRAAPDRCEPLPRIRLAGAGGRGGGVVARAHRRCVVFAVSGHICSRCRS